MNNRSYLQELIILILVVVILLMKFCGTGNKSCPELEPKTVTVTTLVHDTIVHRINVPVPSPADVVFIEAPAIVDTAVILQAYYNEIYYQDNYCDSVIDLYISEGISQNKVAYRDIAYQILRPTQIINTTTITPPAEQSVKVLAGFMIGGTKQELTSISPQIELITKRDNAYMIGYNLSSKSVELGLKWKISLRK